MGHKVRTSDTCIRPCCCPTRPALLASPATSFWLKEALTTQWTRDPVDALRDAEALVHLLKERLNP